jgi:Cu/Ag efflux protein CusF
VVAFALTSGSTFAAELNGQIKSVDPSAGTITLQSGEQFVVSEGVTMQNLKPGEEVTVSYEEKDGKMVATGVQPKSN